MVKHTDDQIKIFEHPVTTSNESFDHCDVEVKGMKHSSRSSTFAILFQLFTWYLM